MTPQNFPIDEYNMATINHLANKRIRLEPEASSIPTNSHVNPITVHLSV